MNARPTPSGALLDDVPSATNGGSSNGGERDNGRCRDEHPAGPTAGARSVGLFGKLAHGRDLRRSRRRRGRRCRGRVLDGGILGHAECPRCRHVDGAGDLEGAVGSLLLGDGGHRVVAVRAIGAAGDRDICGNERRLDR